MSCSVFGQGINERIDIGWPAQVFSSVHEFQDSIVITGGGIEIAPAVRAHFVANKRLDNLLELQSIHSNEYLAGKSSLINSDLFLVGNLTNTGGDSLVIYKIDLLTNTINFRRKYEVPETEGLRIYSTITEDTANIFYSIGGDYRDFDFQGLLLKFNKDGDTIWSQRYIDPMYELEFSSIRINDNSNLLIGGRKYDWMFPDHTDDIHHTYLMEVDSAGIIQWEWTDPENWTYMPYSISKTNDGGVIMGRTKAVLNNTNGNSARCVITKLDELQNIEWEYSIGEYTESIGVMANSLTGIEQVNDTTFVFSGTYNSWGAIDGVLIKITETGNVLWRREFRPQIEASQPQTAVLYDMSSTFDGGFVMVGESKDPDGNGATQQGWIVKTNCLGYLAPPSAACYAGNADNFEMVFYNNSLNGGEFEWDFGDSQTFTSGEGDTVNHTYTGSGPYTVRLIANGCNGEADTIFFDVTPSLASIDEAIEYGEGTFDIYPNPASQKVYLNFNILGDISNTKMTISDISGRIHKSLSVSQNQYVQEFDITNLPIGVYFVNLINENGLIKSRKLVVK